VIAWFVADDVRHARSTAALRSVREEELRLPASAYAEAFARHAVAGSVADARARFDAVAIGIDAIGVDTAEAAASIRARHRALGLPDALSSATPKRSERTSC